MKFEIPFPAGVNSRVAIALGITRLFENELAVAIVNSALPAGPVVMAVGVSPPGKNVE